MSLIHVMMTPMTRGLTKPCISSLPCISLFCTSSLPTHAISVAESTHPNPNAARMVPFRRLGMPLKACRPVVTKVKGKDAVNAYAVHAADDQNGAAAAMGSHKNPGDQASG